MLLGFFTGIVFLGEGSFQGLNFSGEICNGGIGQNSHTTFVEMSSFLFANSVLRVKMLRVIVRGKYSPGCDCLENKSMGKRDFSVDI